jgi:hypothetical protein
MVMIRGITVAYRVMDPRIYETNVVSSYWVHVLQYCMTNSSQNNFDCEAYGS